MINRRMAIIASLFFTTSLSSAQDIDSILKPGVWSGHVDGITRFSILFTNSEQSIGIEEISYKFSASHSVGRVARANGKPFGALNKRSLIFEFPVLTRFALGLSANIFSPSSGSGGEIRLAIYRAEITPTRSGGLQCRLTEINKLSSEFEDLKYSKISLVAPDAGSKMRKQYSFVLMPGEHDAPETTPPVDSDKLRRSTPTQLEKTQYGGWCDQQSDCEKGLVCTENLCMPSAGRAQRQ